ncbi:TIGR04255 family protein [Trichocoleus sp. FACHB-90]|uniref:TIGR04255 family protein n=1 Tax=Cyanophyceae TaxID=3028117 RepID=UPI001683AC1F|nr:TIGR04255 family protein [Trichocoleus sp. FACHB-90]MBD1929795.1 TIGR04255 family protein [Trichocoleus sp. FACHB-90]
MQPLSPYTKPSITEAIIELQAKISSEVALSTLEDIQRSVESEYPLCEQMMSLEAGVQQGEGDSLEATASQSCIGYRFWSKDRKQMFQARLDGFSFHRLAPYEGWETFRDEARRLWNIYQGSVNPKIISRVAVRYINKLDLPLPVNDFKDYLRTVPEISPDLPQGLSDYFMQVKIPQKDLNGMLVLNEAIIPVQRDDVVSVVLDINLSAYVELSANEDEYWKFLEQLRVRKNEIFEACITDNTRRLLK